MLAFVGYDEIAKSDQSYKIVDPCGTGAVLSFFIVSLLLVKVYSVVEAWKEPATRTRRITA